MFCSSCGKEIKHRSAFCADCGASVPGNSKEKIDIQQTIKESEKLKFSKEFVGIKELDFFGYIVKCFNNYVNFDGRARRKELWFFLLFQTICLTVLLLINETLYTIGFLVFFLPSIAVGCRRLHDVGKTGWFQIIPIYPLILFCFDSEKLENEYGPRPK